jgi:diadenosine tetraphosphate (Ap4A) HIT family hydrolase
MALIYENNNFSIQTADRPFIDRLEGGHIRIWAVVPVRDRTKLSPELACEYMMLSMIVGEAMPAALAKQGIDIGLINYQDMGNWSVFKPEGPSLHMQIFGRATTATVQKYGDAVQLPLRDTGFYEGFMPLNETDIALLREEIVRLLATEKYQQFAQLYATGGEAVS